MQASAPKSRSNQVTTRPAQSRNPAAPSRKDDRKDDRRPAREASPDCPSDRDITHANNALFWQLMNRVMNNAPQYVANVDNGITGKELVDSVDKNGLSFVDRGFFPIFSWKTEKAAYRSEKLSEPAKAILTRWDGINYFREDIDEQYELNQDEYDQLKQSVLDAPDDELQTAIYTYFKHRGLRFFVIPGASRTGDDIRVQRRVLPHKMNYSVMLTRLFSPDRCEVVDRLNKYLRPLDVHVEITIHRGTYNLYLVHSKHDEAYVEFLANIEKEHKEYVTNQKSKRDEERTATAPVRGAARGRGGRRFAASGTGRCLATKTARGGAGGKVAYHGEASDDDDDVDVDASGSSSNSDSE